MFPDLTLPHKLSIGILPDEVPSPTLIIRKKGGVKAVGRIYEVEHATVLVQSSDTDEFGTTFAQRKAIQQLVRVILHRNPLCHITFLGGISPWGSQMLYAATFDEPIYEMMKQPHIHSHRYFMRRRKIHPVIKEKRSERLI